MDNWTQSLSAGPLLAIAAGAILLILVMIIRFRVHALLTLVLVSLLTAIVAGLPLEAIVDQVLIKNFGGTLGSVAILVGLGAMLGRLVETSGGAQSLADALVRLFGEKPRRRIADFRFPDFLRCRAGGHAADCVCHCAPHE